MEKEIRIIFIDEAKNELNKLKQDINIELIEGKIGTYKQKLLKSIEDTVHKIVMNPLYGINIKKYLIPNYFKIRYDVNNLRKCNLFDFWRLIYTLRGNDEIIVIDIIEFTDHKDYNKRFGYRS